MLKFALLLSAICLCSLAMEIPSRRGLFFGDIMDSISGDDKEGGGGLNLDPSSIDFSSLIPGGGDKKEEAAPAAAP